MASTTANVDVVKGMKNVTLTVTLKRKNELTLRVWIAKRLIALAVWVMNCNLKIDEVD